ncbi:hypothetical protein Prudu_005600 [Prunus dulcis]|uniref:Uncharacterized protein n=1 Tax=Prunus dulcis TaxID=3755 RepID=A0A4Y1QXY1_PRUDU|nr:hypothetical protein Prudu_005600 [Prunus dulcis]
MGGWPTPNLNDFTVGKCKNFKSLPEGIHTLTALRLLQVDDLPNLESFAEGGLPPNIRHLCIRSCERLTAPVTLLKEHLLPTTLRILVISGCDSILVLPGEGKGLRHLTCLQLLQIDACENLQFLPGEGLQHLTSLRTLSILRVTVSNSCQKREQTKYVLTWHRSSHHHFRQNQPSSIATPASEIGGDEIRADLEASDALVVASCT